MSTKLPTDINAIPIQVLALSNDLINVVVLAASSTATALPTDSDVVRVACSVDSYVAFGDSGVSAGLGTAALFPAGTELFKVPSEATHIALRAVSTDGGATVSRME